MLCTLAHTDPKSCKYQGFIERKTSFLGGRIPCTQICSKAVPLIFYFFYFCCCCCSFSSFSGPRRAPLTPSIGGYAFGSHVIVFKPENPPSSLNRLQLCPLRLCRYYAQCWSCCPGKSNLSRAGSGRSTTEATAICDKFTPTLSGKVSRNMRLTHRWKKITWFNFFAAPTFQPYLAQIPVRFAFCLFVSVENSFFLKKQTNYKILRHVSQEGSQRQSSDQQPVRGQPLRERDREICERKPGHRSDEWCSPSQQTVHQQQQRVLWHRFQGKGVHRCYSVNPSHAKVDCVGGLCMKTWKGAVGYNLGNNTPTKVKN